MDCLALALFGLRAGHHAETQRRARPARVLDSPRERHYRGSREPIETFFGHGAVLRGRFHGKSPPIPNSDLEVHCVSNP